MRFSHHWNANSNGFAIDMSELAGFFLVSFDIIIMLIKLTHTFHSLNQCNNLFIHSFIYWIDFNLLSSFLFHSFILGKHLSSPIRSWNGNDANFQYTLRVNKICKKVSGLIDYITRRVYTWEFQESGEYEVHPYLKHRDGGINIQNECKKLVNMKWSCLYFNSDFFHSWARIQVCLCLYLVA